MEIEERFQWTDPITNQLYWFTQEQLDEVANGHIK